MDKATRKLIIRRTEQEKLNLITEWEKSGQPIKTFCEQHNFSDSLFHTWLNKYRRDQSIKKQTGFTPLHISSQSSMSEDNTTLYAEIILSSGTRIKLY